MNRKHWFVWAIVVSSLLPGLSTLGQAPKLGKIFGEGKIPSKWFQKAKGYEEALEIQKQTGADIFIYFTRQAPPSEKGLCGWFEKKALTDIKMRQFLRDYIKVHVPLPSNPETQKLAEQFNVQKTPAVFVVQPNKRPQYCPVFDWSKGRPELLPVEEIIEALRVRSSLKYQVANPEEAVAPSSSP